ncbi:acyl--CoA ligase [Nocardia colli]|uniref:Acyl--CoA ligase n=1 Tax=Nocardia colli TaxID=2545717 RepID=A0A5N0EI01_9NOCA|nr:class I adenylate-forming enzyme family protein [Nocardia colli]KAA8887715.1 acyl--CoA ligase [Nocardia colli]
MKREHVVGHHNTDADRTIQKYLESFAGSTSTIIGSPLRLSATRSVYQLEGWAATDCLTTFQEGKANSDPYRFSDELIIETSGTTGLPKMVRYQKKVIRNCAVAICQALGLRSDRQYFSLVNPRFAYGLSIMHSHSIADVPVLFYVSPTSLEAWADFREQLQPDSAVYLLPHQSHLLTMDRQWRFDGPIELVFAGGALRSSMVSSLERTFPNAVIVNMYGQAELGPRVSIGRSGIREFREGNVGKPLPGVQIRISSDGTDSAMGRIEIDSPYHMTSYVSPLDAPTVKDGDWWPTGDVGWVTDGGDLWIAGRVAEDINVLGSLLRPAELRKVVCGVTGVLDAQISASDHEIYGQRPSIRVLADTHETNTEAAVRTALATAIGPTASVIEIKVIDIGSLPDSGKL